MKKENFIIDFDNPITIKDNESNVFKAKDKSSKNEYAIKRISKSEDLDTNLEILEKLNDCENSIKYLGSFNSDDNIYIVMELCDYSIAQKMVSKKLEKGNFSIIEIKDIFSDINIALNKMREKNFIHENLKPENILAKMINNKLKYKLSDYGKSFKINKEQTSKYQAPEYNDPEIKDKSKVDLWSIGMILYELHFGDIPKLPINKKNLARSENIFFDDLIRKLLVKTPFKKIEDKNSESDSDDDEEEEEDDEIITKNKKVRITWEEYFNHDFFKNDFLKEMRFLKYSFNNFKTEVKKIISYINEKYKNFKTSIIKEEDEFCSDENNDKIINFKKQLDKYKFKNNEESIIEFLHLTQQSIMKGNKYNEYTEFSNTELIIYKGEVKKNTKIKNGNGKEYYINGELCYEGEYVNDKREGKGKEFSEEGELIFTGKYKNGKQWNGIKKIFDEYEDENGHLIKYIKYIAEIKKGKMNGKCKEFDTNGNMIYIGEYLNGKRNGNGKEYFNDNIIFEGEFKDGKKWNGNAKEYNFKGNLLFEGVYQSGIKYNGKECKYFDDGEKLRYEAEYKDGLLWNAKGYNKNEVFSNLDFEIKNGNGKIKDFYSDNILKLIQDYKGGKKNGKVFSYYNNENKQLEYEGEYIDDIKNGEWKIYYENGFHEFLGNYKNGEKHGECKEYNENGKLIFDGSYNDGVKWKGRERIIYEHNNKKIVIERKYDKGKAECVEYYEHIKYDPKNFDIKGLDFIQKLLKDVQDKKDLSEEINYETYITNLLFVGEYIDDKLIKDKTKRNGKGSEYHDNKLTFEGEYKNGQILNGKGQLFEYKDHLTFEGEYINGKKNGIVVQYYENTDNNLDSDINSKETPQIKYQGKYIDDEKNGIGKEFQYDDKNQPNVIFEGIYKNGKKWDGIGKEYYKMPDKLLFDGEYKEGKRWNGNFFEYSKYMDRLKEKGKYFEGKKVQIKKNDEFENLSVDE